MDRIEVVSTGAPGPVGSGGFGRQKAFETDTVRVGETTIAAGASSPWHHHGSRTLYGFVVSGQLTLEFGPRGAESVRVSAGDFVRIPPGLVHRDVNATGSETVIVNALIGPGPPTIDVQVPPA
ncbi:MAG TPA: cupin domain-containing protein [Thermoplasmata archaeon]|nr:cupin domain-containing protein [Thermoplasmata archaeon]